MSHIVSRTLTFSSSAPLRKRRFSPQRSTFSHPQIKPYTSPIAVQNLGFGANLTDLSHLCELSPFFSRAARTFGLSVFPTFCKKSATLNQPLPDVGRTESATERPSQATCRRHDQFSEKFSEHSSLNKTNGSSRCEPNKETQPNGSCDFNETSCSLDRFFSDVGKSQICTPPGFSFERDQDVQHEDLTRSSSTSGWLFKDDNFRGMQHRSTNVPQGTGRFQIPPPLRGRESGNAPYTTVEVLGRTMLSFSLGLNTGWALQSGSQIINSGAKDFFAPSTRGGGLRFLMFTDWLDTFADSIPSANLSIYFALPTEHTSLHVAHLLGGFISQLMIWCELRDVSCQGVSMGAIRKHALGDDNDQRTPWLTLASNRGHNTNNVPEAEALALLHWAMDFQNKTILQ